jgi:hypothetical protein
VLQRDNARLNECAVYMCAGSMGDTGLMQGMRQARVTSSSTQCLPNNRGRHLATLLLLPALPPFADLLARIPNARERPAADDALERLNRRRPAYRAPQLCNTFILPMRTRAARANIHRRTFGDDLRQPLVPGQLLPVRRRALLEPGHVRIVVLHAREQRRRQLLEVKRARARTHILPDRRRRRRRPLRAGQRDDETVVKLAELRRLCAHDVCDLGAVLRRQQHARVARVRDARERLEQLRLGELGRQQQQRCAHGGRQVHLLRQPHACVILDDPDRLVHAPGEIERVPVQEV